MDITATLLRLKDIISCAPTFEIKNVNFFSFFKRDSCVVYVISSKQLTLPNPNYQLRCNLLDHTTVTARLARSDYPLAHFRTHRFGVVFVLLS